MKTTSYLLVALALAQSVAGQSVTIVENGVAKLPVLVADIKDPLALELQRVMEKISGAKIEIVAATPTSRGVYLGTATDFPWLKLDQETANLGPEGCLVRADGGDLLLIGSGEKGVSHAAMTFLHELGCRWFFPGEAWEVLPEQKTLRGAWNMRVQPSFDIQRLLGYGFGAYEANARDKRLWDMHNRQGSAFPVSIGHAGHGLTAEDFATRPELFAMREGKRVNGSKPCFSHPDFITLTTGRVLEQAAKDAKMISLTPADGLGYCECPLCRDWAKGGEVYWDKGSQFAKRPDGKLVCITSESLFNCINAAAKALSEKYPGVLIGTYAYSAYSHPPSFPVEPNVFIQTTTAYRRTPMSLQEQLESFHAMGVQSGIRGYWSVYQWDWDGPVVTGELSLPKLAQDIRFYHQNNVRSLNTEMSCNWGPRGIGYYVGARLLWNVNDDPKALIADFYLKAFGPAARPMERYYVRWLGEGVRVSAGASAAAASAKPSSPAVPQDELGVAKMDTAAFNRESLKAAFKDLDEAARLVKDLPACKTRVDQLRLYALYLSLRIKLDETAKTGDRDAIVKAIEAETVFGARIMRTNMIHTRPLIGKAFHRRFKAYESQLKGLPEWPEGNSMDGWGKGFRSPREDVPDAAEIEKLWAEASAWL
jgi:hypothetical protein